MGWNQLENNVQGTLDADINNAVTAMAVTLDAGSKNYPAGIDAANPIYLCISDAANALINEIVLVTAVAGADVTTMVRGQRGTAAQAWSAGDVVSLNMQAEDISETRDRVDLCIDDAGNVTAADLDVTGDTTLADAQVDNLVVTATLNGAAGLVGTPTIYLSTDTTTGLYRSAANNLDIAVSGAQAVNVAAAGVTVKLPYLNVQQSGAQANLNITTYYDATSHGIINLYSGRGTLGAPANLQTGDIVGGLYARAWQTGTTFTLCGVVRVVAAENHSNTALGTYCDIYTTPNTTTTAAVAVRISNDKKLQLYGATIETNMSSATDLTVNCGAAKTLVLGTAVYEDINVGSLLLQTGGTLPGKVEILNNAGGGTGIYALGFAIGEEGSSDIEILHGYKEGTNIVFHVHWLVNDAPSGTDYVNWQIEYIVTRDGVTTPAATTITKETAVDTQYMNYRSDFTAVTGTTFKVGDHVGITLSRIAAAGDAYGGEALVKSIGIHYQIDTLGSRSIAAK